MIWKGNGVVMLEEGEPALRSCWECNSCHDRLRNTVFLHLCFDCGKYWILGEYLKQGSDEECDQFFIGKGLKPGDSTQKLKEKL